MSIQDTGFYDRAMRNFLLEYLTYYEEIYIQYPIFDEEYLRKSFKGQENYFCAQISSQHQVVRNFFPGSQEVQRKLCPGFSYQRVITKCFIIDKMICSYVLIQSSILCFSSGNDHFNLLWYNLISQPATKNFDVKSFNSTNCISHHSMVKHSIKTVKDPTSHQSSIKTNDEKI